MSVATVDFFAIDFVALIPRAARSFCAVACCAISCPSITNAFREFRILAFDVRTGINAFFVQTFLSVIAILIF